MYKEPKNNPMIPNKQKEIFKERMNEENKFIPNNDKNENNQDFSNNLKKFNYYPSQPEEKPLLNLQLYPEKKPKPPIQNAVQNPNSYKLGFTNDPFNPIQFSNYMQQFNPPQIIKQYDINLNGLQGNHHRAALIYEDILPDKISLGNQTSLGERISLYEFLRSVFFPSGDGQNIDVDSQNHKSILSHLKFMDLNPYNSYKFSSNPYRGLPHGFLLYRSCYPIRNAMNKSSEVSCAKNSTGMNVRVYKLPDAAYLINKFSDDYSFIKYDQWRELSYYEFIREKVLKKKVCPNFTLMYGYHLPTKSGINFDDLEKVTDVSKQYKPLSEKEIKSNEIISVQKDLVFTSKMENDPDFKKKIEDHLKNATVTSSYMKIPGLEKHPDLKNLKINPNDIMILNKEGLNKKQGILLKNNLSKYTGKAILALTEAQNYNLFGWSSLTYEQHGIHKRMINPGYHPSEVWKNVLFQIATALYVMQINMIYFDNFSIEDNIYIKDLKLSGDVTSCWKYVINGVEYYIANYGYLVMIDSNFKDFNENENNKFLIKKDKDGNFIQRLESKCNETIDGRKIEPIEKKIEIKDINFKINGKIFDSDSNLLGDDEYREKCFEMFKKTFDPDNFGREYFNNGGIMLPEDVKNLLSKIKAEYERPNSSKNIDDYIYKFFGIFNNNRIGTFLKDSEKSNLDKSIDGNQFRKGEICAYLDGTGIEKFCIYLGNNNSNLENEPEIETKAKIITRLDHKDKDTIIHEVEFYKLKKYLQIEPIEQNFKVNGSNLKEDELLEIYFINED